MIDYPIPELPEGFLPSLETRLDFEVEDKVPNYTKAMLYLRKKYEVWSGDSSLAELWREWFRRILSMDDGQEATQWARAYYVESLWAATHNCGTAHPIVAERYLAWRTERETVVLPEGWVLTASWGVAGDVCLMVKSPETEEPDQWGGTVKRRREAAVFTLDPASVDFDALVESAEERRYQGKHSPAEQSFHERRQRARRLTREWAMEDATRRNTAPMGDDPARHTADLFEAVDLYLAMAEAEQDGPLGRGLREDEVGRVEFMFLTLDDSRDDSEGCRSLRDLAAALWGADHPMLGENPEWIESLPRLAPVGGDQ